MSISNTGHRRRRACEIAGLTKMPVTICELDDDTATLIMIDSNLEQRETLLPSEKAWEYRMKLTALNHRGERSDVPGRLSVNILTEHAVRHCFIGGRHGVGYARGGGKNPEKRAGHKHMPGDGYTKQIGTPIDEYVGIGAPSTVCTAAGLSSPKGRLKEIKKTAQANSEIIRRNMETANDSLFDGELDFLDVFSTKPIVENQKKMSSV